MGATTNYALPYPEAADPADVPTDVRELAERLDVVLSQIAATVPPVGAPIPWLVSAIPAGYLEFAGQAITQVQYPKLYALFGATLPDLRGRYLMGVDGTHGIGTAGGAATHTLTLTEMPVHDHPILYNTLAIAAGAANIPSVGGPYQDATGQTVKSAGGGQGHNNLPPYRTVRWLTLAG
jgi:microcystin-dependent protein